MMRAVAPAVVLALASGCPAPARRPVKVEAAIPSYAKTSGVSGNLNSVGSDTMNNMMTLWGEAFAKMYPNVKIQVEGKGSSTAPAALIAGTAQFGPMSRAMRPTEIDQFEAQVRLQAHAAPHLVRRAGRLREQGQPDGEGHPGGDRRRCSRRAAGAGGKNVANWGGLGLTGDWASRPISLYGRNSASGTYGFFKEHVLEQRRLQGHREGAAGLRLRGAGRDRGPLRHRATAASGTARPG